jgi:two-component system, NarL family, response regulator DesR
MTRILVVEDAEIVASGVRATIEEDPDNEVVAVVPSVELAEEIIQARQIDVLVTDIRLADGTAFDLLRRLAEHGSRPRTLIVSSYDLPQFVKAALQMEVSGYVLKTAPARSLLAAIANVAAGGRAYGPGLLHSVTMATQLLLSTQDRQVVAGVLAGRTNDEIGVDMHVSRKTVEFHVSKMLERFGLASRVELAQRAEHEQWLASPTSAYGGDTASNSDR